MQEEKREVLPVQAEDDEASGWEDMGKLIYHFDERPAADPPLIETWTFSPISGQDPIDGITPSDLELWSERDYFDVTTDPDSLKDWRRHTTGWTYWPMIGNDLPIEATVQSVHVRFTFHWGVPSVYHGTDTVALNPNAALNIEWFPVLDMREPGNQQALVGPNMDSPENVNPMLAALVDLWEYERSGNERVFHTVTIELEDWQQFNFDQDRLGLRWRLSPYPPAMADNTVGTVVEQYGYIECKIWTRYGATTFTFVPEGTADPTLVITYTVPGEDEEEIEEVLEIPAISRVAKRIRAAQRGVTYRLR